MEHKNDIGNLIEDRLKNETKAPESNLWDRINTSLDKREDNTSRIKWYTRIGILVMSLILLGFLINTSTKQTGNTIDVTPVIEDNQNSEQNTNHSQVNESGQNKTYTDQLEIDKEVLGSNIKEQVSTKKQAMEEDSYVKNTTNKNHNTDYLNNDGTQDDGFTVTTTYSYYNSETNTTIVTQSKKEIDSLVANSRRQLYLKKQKERDSLDN